MTDPTHSDAPPERPAVLYVCVHNAGRSQMAAGYTRHLSGGAVEVFSAGSAPADHVNSAVVEAMAEEGIDISAEQPKILRTDTVQISDVVITMGCGDVCPIFPGKRYEDWALKDPAGQGVDAVRPIRDEIKDRVIALLGSLKVAPARYWGRVSPLTTAIDPLPQSWAYSRDLDPTSHVMPSSSSLSVHSRPASSWLRATWETRDSPTGPRESPRFVGPY